MAPIGHQVASSWWVPLNFLLLISSTSSIKDPLTKCSVYPLRRRVSDDDDDDDDDDGHDGHDE